MTVISYLHNAKESKNDEYYTQFSDIQKELNHYTDKFEGQTVFCNCDDPFESNFCKFFLMNFNYLKLKRLICTSFAGSSVLGTQGTLFDDSNELLLASNGYVLDVTEVPMENGRGVSESDVKKLLQTRGVVKKLKGNGDFRSDECVEYLKQSTIVCSNPPFSLFREYFSQLMEYKKDFVIICNPNALHYKEVFPYILNDKLWVGYKSMSSDMLFNVSNKFAQWLTENKKEGSGYKIVNGEVKGRAQAIWITSFDILKHHEPFIPYKVYNEIDYPKYDNYDAIEVKKVTEIPKDYYGIMGVPDSFLEVYNPEEFEILGATQKGCHEKVPELKTYDDYWEMRQNGTKTGSSGKKTNGNSNIARNDGKHNYYINKDGHVVQATYSRLFVRRRKL